VLGITGTGGAGKSSLTDELIRRLRLDQDDALRIAVISIDPSRRKSGGALLGDRIRMNAIGPWPRGRACTCAPGHARGRQRDQPALPDVLAACKAAGFDLVIVETSGIGQGDAAIVPLVDVPMYVMTPEFGAASQLEKIDMLDFAEFVAINKFDRKGAADALRDVSQAGAAQPRGLHRSPAMPVFGTMASRFNDDGVTALYQALQAAPGRAGPGAWRRAACRPCHPPQHAPDADRAAGARALPGRHRRHRARLQAARARAGRAGARGAAAARGGAHAARWDKPDKPRAPRPCSLAEEREARLDPQARKLLAHVARHAEGLRRRRVRGEDPRQGDPHRADAHHAVGQQDPQGGAARLRVTTASC
jgi:methylmalonyl-CoA mutase